MNMVNRNKKTKSNELAKADLIANLDMPDILQALQDANDVLESRKKLDANEAELQIVKLVNQYQIPYTKLWCIFDYYEQRHQVEFYDDGSFHVDDELWNKAKAEYCKEQNLNRD